tara:strand:+ start:987 stop:1151 length:165 start_codon:yes stop_codon:yes gene_type:complete
MEEIQDKIENLIDDIERDSTLTNTDIITILYQIKEQIEDYNLNKNEGLQWEDLD